MISGGTRARSSIGALALVFFAAYASVFACSSSEPSQTARPAKANDAGFDTKPSPESGLGVLTFMPRTSFSGFDGTHTFTVPVAVYDSAEDLELVASDSSAVDIAPKRLAAPVRSDGTIDNGKYFFVTVKKAGTTKLTARSNGATAETTLTVTPYATGVWEAGESRYKSGRGADPPCTTCHVDGQAIDHSPAALATSTDEEIAIVITTGISTSGFPIKIDGEPGHQWTVTDAERDGLVTYLRSLAPRGFE
jgi:hypothetical protein